MQSRINAHPSSTNDLARNNSRLFLRSFFSRARSLFVRNVEPSIIFAVSRVPYRVRKFIFLYCLRAFLRLLSENTVYHNFHGWRAQIMRYQTRVRLLRIITAHNWPHDVKISVLIIVVCERRACCIPSRRYEHTRRANRWAGCALAHPVSPHLIKLARYIPRNIRLWTN